MKNLIILLTALVIATPTFQPVFADADDINASYTGLVWAPDGLSDCLAQGSLSPGTLSDTVPEPYNSLFILAANEYGIDVVTLATIFYTENRGFPEPPPPYGTGDPWPVSHGGAKGPFQFLDGTWESYGVDANGDGRKDVNDLEDASHGAANFILALGGVYGLPLGSLDDPDFVNKDPDSTSPTVARVFKSYNAGPYTWRDPDTGLWMEGSSGPWEPTKQVEIDAYITIGLETYTQIAVGSSLEDPTDDSGSCDGLGDYGVSPEGFVFPLRTTQDKIINDPESIARYGGPWCYESLENCHHDYNAADIFVETGTWVIAAQPGTVVRSVPNQSTGVGSRVTILGDDKAVYYYTHMGPGTIAVSVGQHVEGADKLGEVGTDEQAVGTVRHLHFDMLPPPYTQRPSCSGAECTAYEFINVQPFLVPAFQALGAGG